MQIQPNELDKIAFLLEKINAPFLKELDPPRRRLRISGYNLIMNTDFIDMRTRKGNLEYNKNLKLLARENRKNPTKAELLFWNMIVRKERLNYKFLRQKAIGNYIVDFYCAKLCLAIEVDGDSHDLKDNYDFERELFLKRRGIKIIHYENEQVFKYLENIFEDLKRVITDRKIELNSEIPHPPEADTPFK